MALFLVQFSKKTIFEQRSIKNLQAKFIAALVVDEADLIGVEHDLEWVEQQQPIVILQAFKICSTST